MYIFTYTHMSFMCRCEHTWIETHICIYVWYLYYMRCVPPAALHIHFSGQCLPLSSPWDCSRRRHVPEARIKRNEMDKPIEESKNGKSSVVSDWSKEKLLVVIHYWLEASNGQRCALSVLHPFHCPWTERKCKNKSDMFCMSTRLLHGRSIIVTSVEISCK